MEIKITNQTIFDELKKKSEKRLLRRSRPMITELWNSFENSYKTSAEHSWTRTYYIPEVFVEYEKLTGKKALNCQTLDEFFCSKFVSDLNFYFGEEETVRIIEECRAIMEFPYSHSTYRPSYRSTCASDYVELFFAAIINSIFYQCYGYGRLYTKSVNRIAMDLRHGEKETCAAVEEIVFGDSSEEKFSHFIIAAIVKSGNPKMLESLGKLLLAAKGQEGLRQAVVETCDCGLISSHIYFIKLILDNDLCRFSSVIRAFDTWTGLSYADQKQKVVEKMMVLAIEFLKDESAAHKALSSADTTEIYIGLWALSVHDVHSATDSALELLNATEKYRRLVGWYFITSTNNDIFRHNIASKFLHVRDLEELAWVTLNIKTNSDIGSYYYSSDFNEKLEKEDTTKKYPTDYYPSDEKERLELFSQALSAMEFIGKKSSKFSPSVFPWYEMELSTRNLFGFMMALAAYDRNEELTMKIGDYLHNTDSDSRCSYYRRLLNPNIAHHRTILLKGLGDKSPTAKTLILKRLMFYKLSGEDTLTLEKSLTTKSAPQRMAIVSLLEKQETNLVTPVIDNLLESSNNSQVLAGVELLEILTKKQPDLATKYKEKILALSDKGGLGKDFEILSKRIYPDPSSSTELTLENGFGIFNPKNELLTLEYWASKRPKLAILSDGDLKKLTLPNEKETLDLYNRILEVFVDNKDYEYEMETYYGRKEMALLGDELKNLSNWKADNLKGIYKYPLAEKWLEAAGDFTSSPEKLATILSLRSRSFSENEYKSWFIDLFKKYLILEKDSPLKEKIRESYKINLWWRNLANIIIFEIMNTPDGTLFDFSLGVYVNLFEKIPVDKLTELCTQKPKNSNYYSYSKGELPLETDYLVYWRNLARNQIQNDDQFKIYFSEMWYQCLAAGGTVYYDLYPEDILRAHSLGVITEEVVYYYLLTYSRGERYYSHPFKELMGKEILDKYPAAKNIIAKAVDIVLSVESNRGELVTELTYVVPAIGVFNGGINHFVKLLAALGNTAFSRSYNQYWQDAASLTKKDSLSQLLRKCHPSDNDTASDLASLLKSSKITENRCLQTALFAPQWAPILEEALNLPGLKSGVWFFHAHVNEHFSAEKETETAIFSAISPQQFNDGAFDKDWFFEAYNSLGEKRFNELYKNAKLITESNIAHRRSQLYTEAVLGKIDKNEILAEIKEKRNQERLRAYALIPLDESNSSDALERYEYINLFKKESRQFGSQRQTSEGKAVEIALDNLAITTGFADADRMTWSLESQKMQQLSHLMEWFPIGDYTTRLVIHPDGTPEVEVQKKGKPLKSMPKELNKDEYVADLKDAVKALKAQKSRAKLKFELAMVSQAQFKSDEIVRLLENPVLSCFVSDLVFVSGSKLGFPVLSKGKLELKSSDNNLSKITSDLVIAHPYSFIKHKCWSSYQQYIFTNQIKQPFKQVFREYYPIIEDEKKAVNVSTRYEGYQVQPNKTVALLKTRGWTVDYEDGLQRVWHKENLVVRMYAMADWFSPADIEAPTLETIQFYKRDTWDLVPFEDVPEIIFSETMRDIDLVVSVAYVGGVDPEASHSTVEMRLAILREMMVLLAVENVTFKTAHAIIKGEYGEYSIHLGSGVVHKIGAGMVAVLPVHSQHRGRIFLPFVDDDPKTAEIISKILLFAQDKKIKDPGILSQICGK